MRIGRRTKLGLGCSIMLLVIGASGCGGGDGDFPPVEITITNCDSTTFAAQGIVCVDFLVTGFHPGPLGVLAQFSAFPGAPLEGATPIPPELAAQLGIVSITGPVIAQNKAQTPYRFCWYAGADLGFIAAAGVSLFLTPVSLQTSDPIGNADSCGGLFYAGGGQTQAASGPALQPRAGHCAEHVGGKSMTIAGGYGASSFVHDSVERLTFDDTGFNYTKTNPLAFVMQSPRVNHACSFFLDPTTEAIKVLITGGDASIPAPTPTMSADVYCFTPVEQLMPTTGLMNVARRHHTATWIPSNKVVIIGGSNGTNALCSIEIFDPLTGLFTLQTAALTSCRQEHTATLLPTGKILVAGGVNPASGVALPAELYDPATGGVMTVPGPLVDRIRHTATRLANGWVLVAGGFLASNNASVTASSQIFEPELGAMGEFTSLAPLMNWPRAQHAASLLGDGHALLTGGRIDGVGCPVVTATAEVFLPESLTFTPTVSMIAGREDHTSTATTCGFVALIGGTNDAGCAQNFLATVEVYPFDNKNPVVESAAALATGVPGTADIDVGVTDEDADGGYLIIRYRVGTGMFMLATIIQQTPSSAPAGFPNMQVAALPTPGAHYSFRWNYAANGLSAGQSVEVEVLPVGATLGTPVTFTTALP